MALTAAQKLTLRTNIQANTTQLAFSGGTAAINAVFAGASLNAGDALLIAEWYNLTAVPDFFVWKDLPMEDVLNLITFANMTPVDAIPTVTSLPSNPTSAQNSTYSNQMATVHQWNGRSLSCQGKQFNLQNLTIGRNVAPMKRTNYRAAMQDCLTNIPAGVNGAALAANWVGVRDAAKRLTNNLERVFATGTGSQAVPGDVVVEGTITGDEISDIHGLPA